MHVVAQALQVDFPGVAWKIGRRPQLHLQAEGQVLLPVGIGQVLDSPLRGLAQPVEEHDLGRRPAVHLRHQMHILPHSIPVDVQHHLDRRVFLQDARHPLQGVVVGLAPVQLSLPQVIDRGVMVHRVPLLREKAGQLLPHSHHVFPRPGIREGLLGVGVVNENLRSPGAGVQRQVHIQQGFGVHQFPIRRGGGVHIIKILHQEIIIHQLLQHICTPENGPVQASRKGLGRGEASALPCRALACPASRPALASVSCCSPEALGQRPIFLCVRSRLLPAVPGQIGVLFIKPLHSLVIPVGGIRILPPFPARAVRLPPRFLYKKIPLLVPQTLRYPGSSGPKSPP